MKSTVEYIGTNQAKITLTSDNDEFTKALQTAYIKTRGRYMIPGFRKGKAPRHMIERNYGEGVFFEAAVDDLYPKVYMEAIKEHELKVAGNPDLDLETISTEGFTMTATVYIFPQFEPGEYCGLTVKTRPAEPVTDEEVNARVEADRDQIARFVEVTRPAVSGDTLTIDFTGYVDGEAFEGGFAENEELTIGSNRFIEGFEEQLIGLDTDSEAEIKVTFPEDYQEKSLASKEATFKIKVKGIKEKQLPDVDDEFAKDVSEFDTLDEYKADILAKLTKERQAERERNINDLIRKKAVDGVDIDVPPPTIEKQLDRLMSNMLYSLYMRGYKVDSIVNNEETMKNLRDNLKEQAVTEVKWQLLIDKIVDREKPEISDEAFNEAVNEMAESRGVTPEDYLKDMTDDAQDDIRYDLKAKAVIAKMRESAVIIETDEPETETEDDGKFQELANDLLGGLEKWMDDEEYEEYDEDYDDEDDDDDYDDEDDE